MEQMSYGFFPGGDPRNFTPDFESCSEKEINDWEEACQQWNEGKRVVCEGSHRWLVDSEGKIVGTATVSSFGIGVYMFDDEGEEDGEQLTCDDELNLPPGHRPTESA